MLSPLYDSLLTLTYPESCRICESSVESAHLGIVCACCWEATRIFTGNETLCAKCGVFLKPSMAAAEAFCRNCDDHNYDLARAVGEYNKGILASILFLKGHPTISAHLIGLLHATFDKQNIDVTRIIPVPLSKERFKERGFNQSAVIAQILEKHTGLRMDDTALIRTVHTEKDRRAMDSRSRAESVKDAFEVRHPKLIRGERILLVDDVMATGATVSNCAKTLKDAGAQSVHVLTLARAA